ncbi:MAG: DUF5615 family PIN-like protein [Chloroflexota bacterium]
MAISLLLDEHISPRAAVSLRARGRDVLGLQEWRGGRFLKMPDDVLLRAAHEEGRTLVTYDVNTIPAQLRRFAAAGIEHSGVIFVSSRTISYDDIGGLVRALEKLLDERAADDLRNQQIFLAR